MACASLLPVAVTLLNVFVLTPPMFSPIWTPRIRLLLVVRSVKTNVEVPPRVVSRAPLPPLLEAVSPVELNAVERAAGEHADLQAGVDRVVERGVVELIETDDRSGEEQNLGPIVARQAAIESVDRVFAGRVVVVVMQRIRRRR